MSNTHELQNLPYLTESDVALLHDIIQRAEDSRERSSRALFQAYDNVLAEREIDADRDQKYFRFLLRMRESPNRSTKTLLEQFTELLAKLGIHVVFDEDEQSDAPSKQNRASSDHTDPAPSSGPQKYEEAHAQTWTSPARTRRASFNEFEDSGPAPSGDEILPRPQISARSVSHNDMPKIGSKPPHAPSITQALANGHAVLSTNGVPARRSSILSPLRPQRKPVVQIRDEPSIYEFEQSVVSDEVSDTDEDKSRDVHGTSSNVNSNASGNDRDATAGAFRFRRLAAQAHLIFHDWLLKTRGSRNRKQQESEQAFQRYSNVLKKDALEKWHDRLRAQRHERETEKFFEALERRAGRARDLFLLARSFTHWAQYASDQVSRTSAARRHILRTRFFNAWRDITVVNELKVRRQGISKFFRDWKDRKSQLSALEQTASSFRESHLTQISYRDWFWEFCDRRAPLWHDTRIQERCWDHWSQLAQGYAIRDRWSESYGRLQTLRKTWSLWSQSLKEAHERDSKAHDFCRRTMLIQSLEALRRRLFYADPVGRMARARNAKLLRANFDTWLAQARLSLVSKKTHDSRLKRNAWTSWNDRLRSQALARGVEDRVLTQALYRWVLAERSALLRRVLIENQKRAVFATWRQQTQRTCSHVGKAEYWVSLTQTIKLKSYALRKLQDEVQTRRQDKLRAMHFAQQRKHAQVFTYWRGRLGELQKLQQWSTSRLYVSFTAPVLRKWHSKFELTKKTRRREAYATVRLRRKQAVVRRILLQWRGATTAVLDDNARARRQRDETLASARLIQWQATSHRLWATEQQIRQSHDERVVRWVWSRLIERHQQIQLLDAQAQEFLIERIELPAADACLQKLSWQLFKIRADQDKAEALRRRNEEKHHRLMLLRLRDVARQRRAEQSPPQSPSLSARQNTTTRNPAPTGHASTDLDSDAAAAPAASTPAYLQTPSRRTTGRLRKRMAVPPTTHAASYVTPFMDRLKGQYPSGLPRATHVGASRNGRWGVADIPESSPVREGGG